MTKPLSDEKIEELWHSSGAPHTGVIGFARAIEAAVLEAQGKQEPVAWCVAYDDPRIGRIHSNPSMCEPQVDLHVSKCGGVVVKVSLYAAPITANANVQPATTVDCIGLALDLEFRAKTVESQTTERAMLAAANGLRLIAALSSNAEGTPTPD